MEGDLFAVDNNQTPAVAPVTANCPGSPIESSRNCLRMNLGAFKALGGVYAVARMIADAWQAAGNEPLKPEEYTSDAVRELAAGMTFVCATAGNHGMAVAAGARIFGATARIYLAKEGVDLKTVQWAAH